jgi:hypothetical protein
MDKSIKLHIDDLIEADGLTVDEMKLRIKSLIAMAKEMQAALEDGYVDLALSYVDSLESATKRLRKEVSGAYLEMVDMIERQINVARNTIVLNYG